MQPATAQNEPPTLWSASNGALRRPCTCAPGLDHRCIFHPGRERDGNRRCSQSGSWSIVRLCGPDGLRACRTLWHRCVQLRNSYDWDSGASFLVGLVAGIVVPGVVAFITGIPTLKLRGHYLAIATLALQLGIVEFLVQASELTGGNSRHFRNQTSLLIWDIAQILHGLL